jgi:hypothetical protein
MDLKTETISAIWSARREIDCGTKLLEEIDKTRKEFRIDTNQPVIKDAFGRRPCIELGVPSSSNSHRLFQVSQELAEIVINAHINQKKSELKALLLTAKTELNGDE